MKIKEDKHTDHLASNGDILAEWNAARQFAALIGDSPRFIRATIHFLKHDLEENKNEMSFRSRSCLTPLLRGAEFQAVIYYAAKTFFPERLQTTPITDSRGLAKLFKPDEFIALISIMYLYRRMKRGCERESFVNFIKNIFSDWLYAGAVGRSIERIGFADGLLYGVMPYLAQCLFLGVDRKAFKTYRVHVRTREQQWDLNQERAIWGCHCLQVAVLLAQGLGLGRHYHDPFMLGLSGTDLESVKNNDTLYAPRLLNVWLHSLKKTGEAPDMPHRGEFYPFASEMKRLGDFVKEQRGAEWEKMFLERNKNDVHPQRTPELFSDGERIPSTSELMNQETLISALQDLPEEIRNDFPEDIDLDEMLS